MKSAKSNTDIREDVWVPTMCARCYQLCGINVRRINGVAVKIEGVPDSMQGARGGLCGKGAAGLQVLYDPNRLDVPLRRTNPEKGLDVDPKWEEITWEEAYAEIIPRLKRVLEENPERLTSIMGPQWMPWRFNQILEMLFGPFPMYVVGLGMHCGNGAHPIGGLIHGSWSIVHDFRYCNYALYFGSSKGHGSGHSAMVSQLVSL